MCPTLGTSSQTVNGYGDENVGRVTLLERRDCAHHKLARGSIESFHGREGCGARKYVFESPDRLGAGERQFVPWSASRALQGRQDMLKLGHLSHKLEGWRSTVKGRRAPANQSVDTART